MYGFFSVIETVRSGRKGLSMVRRESETKLDHVAYVCVCCIAFKCKGICRVCPNTCRSSGGLCAVC